MAGRPRSKSRVNGRLRTHPSGCVPGRSGRARATPVGTGAASRSRTSRSRPPIGWYRQVEHNAAGGFSGWSYKQHTPKPSRRVATCEIRTRACVCSGSTSRRRACRVVLGTDRQSRASKVRRLPRTLKELSEEAVEKRSCPVPTDQLAGDIVISRKRSRTYRRAWSICGPSSSASASRIDTHLAYIKWIGVFIAGLLVASSAVPAAWCGGLGLTPWLSRGPDREVENEVKQQGTRIERVENEVKQQGDPDREGRKTGWDRWPAGRHGQAARHPHPPHGAKARVIMWVTGDGWR